MNRRSTLTCMAVVAALATTGCATLQAPANIVDTAARTPELSTLYKLIGDAGLAETLSSGGPFTVFAPSNEAFKAVPAKTLAELGQNKAMLKDMLSYHVLPAKVAATEVKVGNAKTVQGGNVSLGVAGAIVTVEDAMVIKADIGASNGVVHVIDRVLTPPKR